MTVVARAFMTMLAVAVVGAVGLTTVQTPAQTTGRRPPRRRGRAPRPSRSRAGTRLTSSRTSTGLALPGAPGSRCSTPAPRAGRSTRSREACAPWSGWGRSARLAATSGFKASVRRLAANKKVFGYYLSDEPHIGDCPGGPAALRSRAKFIAAASQGRQRSFVVLSERADYRAFRPAVTGGEPGRAQPLPVLRGAPVL